MESNDSLGRPIDTKQLLKYRIIILVASLTGIIATTISLWFCAESTLGKDLDISLLRKVVLIYIIVILSTTAIINLTLASINISLLNSREMPTAIKLFASSILCVL